MTAVLHGPGANERPVNEDDDAVDGVIELVSLAEQAAEVETLTESSHVSGAEPAAEVGSSLVREAGLSQMAEMGHVPAPGSPMHCGAAMSLSVSPGPVTSGRSDGEVWPAWACSCGFRMDAEASDFVGSVWTAAALVESLQWEMDSAKESLGHAVRQATLAGVEGRDLQLASGLTEPDLKELLG